MLSFLIGLVGSVVGLVGWFAFHSVPLLVAGTALYIIETIMERKNLNTGAKMLDLLIFGIGCVVGLLLKIPIYVGGMIAIHIYSAIMGIIGLLKIGRFGSGS